jgi:hypothetical protein
MIERELFIHQGKAGDSRQSIGLFVDSMQSGFLCVHSEPRSDIFGISRNKYPQITDTSRARASIGRNQARSVQVLFKDNKKPTAVKPHGK